ncbi:M56 family metallopeptidase [uncultured Winogradskyella sp.]|uniref:M56 family metallopeptidase n=1 Tax=uncultured Winogradskyella sp. TaxID=395353 RepID=UPI0030DC5D20|tara:strand:- start:18797 stop:21166 length:2370 start_codon:yes stop_codon:yes gene_type:complete
MLYTIIQIIAFQALFLLVYDVFLKGETFFNYNRAYLLITSVLSLLLPFIKLPKLKTLATNDFVIQLPEVFLGTAAPTANDVFVSAQAGIIIEQPAIPLWQTVLVMGATIALLFFVFKLMRLYWMRLNNPKHWQGNILIVSLIKSTAAFSFFNTIFLGERISETDKPTIYKHELVHIKELHTLDLLLFELLRIVMWFNPLVYLYQNRIKELHEYIADEKAVKQHGKSLYYQNLLNQIFDVHNVSFTNTFFKKSLIKKRIAMLQKSKSKQLNLIKYTLLIPMVFGMLIYTSTEVRAQEKAKATTEVTQEPSEEELIKKYIKELEQMEKDGASLTEIYEYGFSKENTYKYTMSKGEFLKTKALLRYISSKGIAMKSEDGTLIQEDFNKSENLKNSGHKTYSDYRKWLKTQEAKALWEANINDGEIKLFIEDIENKTDEEKKRYDSIMDQMITDENVDKFIYASYNFTMVLTDFKDENSKLNSSTSKIVESVEVPFSLIEEVPILTECKDLPTNAERKKCMSDFVTSFVNKRFNINLADSLNLSSGRKRIFVSFKINKEGFVSDVKARGPHPGLETEAKRVISMLPQFIPGRQKGIAVTVPYSLPIVFQVQGENVSKTPSYDEFIKYLEAKKINKDSLSEDIKEELYKSLTQKRKEELYVKYLEDKIDQFEENTDAIPFSKIELAPAFVDCELITDNKARKKCTSKDVNMFVNKNFNLNIASELGIKGRQKIYVSYIINKQGNVINIASRASHPKLEEEAKRVISQLPQFMPGIHEGETVNVACSLPIIFQIN